MAEPAAGPVALITGCSSGIGLATAVELARQGCRVVATMRDLGRSGPLSAALAAAGLEVDLRVLDAADDESVASVTAAVLAEHGGIDIVVSNAGMGVEGTTEEVSLDEFRASFEVNTLGSVRLLHAVLPGWRAKRAGRFIAISSVSGAVGFPFNDAYCASKFALEGLIEAMHPVVATFGIHVSVIEPGPVAGDFREHTASPSRREAADPYAPARTAFQKIQSAGFDNAQSNDDIAALVWQVASAPAPVLRYQSSDTVARLIGQKLKDLSGERFTGLMARWVVPEQE
jgi:NAD(P)-dependent dehydrogenase (short-subunit alcohol dehydrogenase family)